MNKKFYELDESKQARFKRAGYKVFSENTYKKASMKDLADEADISKALIFHYFRNKSTLYEWLFKEAINDIDVFQEISVVDGCDFFDLIDEIIVKRLEFLARYNLCYEFVLKVLEEKGLEDHDSILKSIYTKSMERKEMILKKVETRKFKSENELPLLYDLLLDLGQGYYMKMKGGDFNKEAIMAPFRSYLISIKSHYYKEIYL